ncbi:hypothetical protein ANN_05805 [Periplaneta americana]|uniref:Per a allergen n=1 Tax=Periplaneta americana TaxID=6978 RepID=A0ABQ8TDJ1_PERAM|nr:hypothetical protein ANN_05805 [Periplaneta americana]
MAGLCEGSNEPLDSLQAICNAWKLWIHDEGQQGGGVKLTRKASETRLAAPGEEVASPIVLVSGFALAAPGEEVTSLTIACMSMSDIL